MFIVMQLLIPRAYTRGYCCAVPSSFARRATADKLAQESSMFFSPDGEQKSIILYPEFISWHFASSQSRNILLHVHLHRERYRIFCDYGLCHMQ
jgi:hypothetical protein